MAFESLSERLNKAFKNMKPIDTQLNAILVDYVK